ncbi:uncharacterized protein cubi_00196 [Cryptosporidium ubiquitum]|uniref:Uncharacterized protein n=1 Tax=Cryptosporidium ubiquitum TaxID=857276 RepID=A0A1J4MMF6_9CRYT|nr:uncharacterized protein cubi_00196 [Cryptosporidium ubiquitum]OII74643.1 hypothetical protein cubi_00196 [Cryptosporidium ubiquitum]
MPENYQTNIGKSSKISDLSSKIREAENDLSISRGIKLRNNSLGNQSKHMNGLAFNKSAQDSKEVSELHILRLKQIETAQRLKETLRRNVDLMTELQKARGVVRNLEKKLSLIERAESVNLLHDNAAKDIIPPCNHCPKQQEEINKLKLHIIEMNESFQKRWDDTQRELLQAKQSLSDVSSKLFDSMNNYQMKSPQETSQIQSFNDGTNEFMEESSHFNDRVLERYKNNNTNNIIYHRNGSEAQSPSTYRLSRPSSSNLSNDLNGRNLNLNSYSRISSRISNIQYNEYAHQPETPKASFNNRNIRNLLLNHDRRNDPNIVIKHNRPQSEHLIKYSLPETARVLPNNHNKSSSGFYQTAKDGINYDPITQIRSLDSITINPGLNTHANSFPPGLSCNVSNRRYDLNSRDLIPNNLTNPLVYPNSYSSYILSSQNKIQTQSDLFVSGVETFSSNKIKNSIFPGSKNTSCDTQHFDNNSIIPNQIEGECLNETTNYRSYSVTDSNNLQSSISPPSNCQTIIEPIKDQAVNNYNTSFNENLDEYPSSPATKDSLNELEIDQSTYGNIRKTLEELKKTQDQRVQQLKDDREKLLRAVLSDLQEMKDFKTNLNSIKENQERMINTAPKSLFSLEDSSKYDNI